MIPGSCGLEHGGSTGDYTESETSQRGSGIMLPGSCGLEHGGRMAENTEAETSRHWRSIMSKSYIPVHERIKKFYEIYENGCIKTEIWEWYYSTGQLESRSWWVKNQFHRVGDKPAYERYYATGHLRSRSWWVDGKRHRVGDKPTCEEYYE